MDCCDGLPRTMYGEGCGLACSAFYIRYPLPRLARDRCASMNSRPKSRSACSWLWAWQRSVMLAGECSPPRAQGVSWWYSMLRVPRQRFPSASRQVQRPRSRCQISRRTAAGIARERVGVEWLPDLVPALAQSFRLSISAMASRSCAVQRRSSVTRSAKRRSSSAWESCRYWSVRFMRTAYHGDFQTGLVEVPAGYGDAR